MCDTCDDSRFELIGKYKQKLLDATNIEDSPEEMAVIDNVLFRLWQIGWLEKLEQFGNSERLSSSCGHEKDHVADPGKMVGDLISRQTALDALGERPVVWSDNDDYTLGARNQYDMDRLAIETLPSVRQWIPCKTALPEKRKYVLCQCRAGIMDVLRLTDDNDWYKDSTHIYMYGFVVAWCPLPEPWKGRQGG